MFSRYTEVKKAIAYAVPEFVAASVLFAKFLERPEIVVYSFIILLVVWIVTMFLWIIEIARPSLPA